MIAPLFGSITRPLLSPLVSGLRDELFGAFTPRSLFNDGSIGVLYDNNDLTTMFVDAAGTTPATVNGLVGLQLDKSAGLVLGAELAPATNSVSGWTPNANCTIATVGGELEITATAVGVCVADFNVSGTSAGKNYLLTAVCRQGQVGGSGASVAIAFGSVPYSAANTTTTNASVRVVKIGTVGAEILRIRFDSTVIGQKAYFSLLSFREIPGNHRYQTTTGSKPILRGTPTGGNLVTNGDFASGTGWTLSNGATIAGGRLNLDGVTSLPGGIIFATSTFTPTIGKVYRVTWSITSSTTLEVSPSLGGASATQRSAVGTYVDYLTATTTAALTIISRGSVGVRGGSIDNIEIVDVSAGSVTAPYGLQYDGVDDFLQTASVNFSATDKMFVCAGVRKLSDAGAAVIVELSASSSTTANTFAMFAPASAGVDGYSMRSRGNAASPIDRGLTGFAAPVTTVVSGIGDIAGDICRIRANGANEATATTDQGTGNYRNDIIYFGRRAGTSLPFNGLDFGFVIVGKTLTAAQVSSTERWMAQRTGVSI